MRKKSVVTQMICISATMVLILLIAFIITGRYVKAVLRENTLEAECRIMTQLEQKFEDYNQTMTQIITSMAYSPTVYSFFSQDARNRVISSDDVNTVFSNTILLENNIFGIYLFDRNMEQIAEIGKDTQELMDMGIISELKAEQEYSNLFYYSDSNTPYYAIYFPVFNLENQNYGQQIGMCVLVMKTDNFGEFLRETQVTEHEEVYLIDGNDGILTTQGGQEKNVFQVEMKQNSDDFYVCA